MSPDMTQTGNPSKYTEGVPGKGEKKTALFSEKKLYNADAI
jgi:hypothetical protein